ncbi:hypothetical protein ACVIM5_001587 [Bradyrhizobium sp. USDA 4512]
MVCASVIRVSASIPIVRISEDTSTFGCAAIARVGRSSSHIGGIEVVPPVPCSGIERQALAHCVRALFWNTGSLCNRASTTEIWSATALSMTGLTWAGTLMRTPAVDRLVSPRLTCA